MRWTCLAMLCLLSVSAPLRAQDVVTIDTGAVRGQAESGLRIFRGLPFAAPPIGERRWRAPAPAVAWRGLRDARRFGAACLQAPTLADATGGDPGRMSEDCLNLNVWTPARGTTEGLPVLVWIHGGALVIGGGAVPVYDGRPLASQGLVVVTVNYRLGALGFFAHPSVTGSSGDANFGLLDQIAALQWVQRNIAAFGGDSKRVTIAGQSAGAQSVLALMASPKARGLFARAIAQSPYGIPNHPRTKAAEAGRAVALAVGLPADADARALRAVPASRFVGLKGKATNLAPGFIIGDPAVPVALLSAFQQGREAKVPLLLGSNSNEASVASDFGVDPAAVLGKIRGAKVGLGLLYPGVRDDRSLALQATRDLLFTAFSRRIAALHSQRAPTWRYYFDYLAEGRRGSAPGVGHSDELVFVFGTGDSCGCTKWSDADRAEARGVQRRWVAFVRDGVPGADWPRDTMRTQQVLEFGPHPSPVPRRGFMAARLNAMIGLLNVAQKFL